MAMFKEVVQLITFTVIKDSIKQEVEVKKERDVFANQRSVPQSEFFSAGQSGIKAEKMFEIRLIDYEEETLLSFNNKVYSIYRTYPKGENIELYCEVRIRGH